MTIQQRIIAGMVVVVGAITIYAVTLVGGEGEWTQAVGVEKYECTDDDGPAQCTRLVHIAVRGDDVTRCGTTCDLHLSTLPAECATEHLCALCGEFVCQSWSGCDPKGTGCIPWPCEIVSGMDPGVEALQPCTVSP
jgi:hypothetical protein